MVYSEFLEMVRAGNVRKARIDESLQKVYFSVDPVSEQQPQAAAVPDARTSRARPGASISGAAAVWFSKATLQAMVSLDCLISDILTCMLIWQAR